MQERPSPWQHGSVLVCTHQRDPSAAKASCGASRGGRLREHLKASLRAQSGPAGQCRVVKTGCLGVCDAAGVAVVMEPGMRTFVVDPVHDADAIVAEAVAHMDRAAAGSSQARSPRGPLGRLKARVRGS